MSSQLSLYIDTNIFLDHFLQRRGRSSALLRVIAAGRFFGVTSHFTLSEIVGVLKASGVPQNRIDYIINQVESFPNISIIFHDQNIFLTCPDVSLILVCSVEMPFISWLLRFSQLTI